MMFDTGSILGAIGGFFLMIGFALLLPWLLLWSYYFAIFAGKYIEWVWG